MKSLMFLLLAGAFSAHALPQGFVDTLVAGGFRSPTAFDFGPAAGTFYVAEKGGTIVRVTSVGQSQTVKRFSVSTDGERGLLGLAAADEGLYAYLTTPEPRNRVVRLAWPGLGNDRVLFETPTLGPTNHNAGGLRIWNEFLLAGVGENANPSNAQNPSVPLGKLIRIPRSGGAWKVHAMGLRNPFRLDVAPDGSGVIADVGQDSWEEVNVLQKMAGANYGWPNREGAGGGGGYVSPLAAYSHQNGRCAIIGIGLYPSNASLNFGPDYAGGVFFSDYCTSELFFRSRSGAVRTFGTGIQAVDIRISPQGDLYYLSYGRGQLRKISASFAGPTFDERPQDVTLLSNTTSSANFRCRSAGSVIRWFRNGRQIAVGKVSVTVSGLTNGTVVTCQATKGGKTISASAKVTILIVRPPSVFLVTPTDGSYYAPRTFLTISGFADPPSCFLKFEVFLHHDQHRHPWRSAPLLANVTRLVKAPGSETEPSRSVFLKVTLFATDPATGLTRSASARVFPPPLNLPAVVFSPWARFKAGPSWTDGPFRYLNGSASVGEEFNVTGTGNWTLAVPGAVGNFQVDISGQGRVGNVNSTSNITLLLSQGIVRVTLSSPGPARLGNLSIST